ncbi:MAG: molybdate ABC transporter substrate-binding protein [Magnetovibrio sp.]|nr:molybdate ABC transporter substrate-binding protein [Magnetovibrio sp.]
MPFFRLLYLTLVGFFFAIRPVAADTIRVFAAASTQPVIEALSLDLKDADITVTAVYASSATLARHIEYGAPADVYITSNGKWMDYLANLGLIQPKTRRTIATNRLALISAQNINLEDVIKNIAKTLQADRLAIADPNSVPAGQYAKEALISTKQWQALQDHLAPTKDVTGALMLVARGEAPLGIVYASDVLRSTKIKAFALFPKNSHSLISYQAAAITGAQSLALKKFLNVLSGPQGRTAFRRAGFKLHPGFEAAQP